MAGRFLLQKFSSGTSRSTSIIGAHASTSARAAAPVIPRDLAAGIKILSNVFRGAVHPCMALTSNHGTQGNAARYFNTVSIPHAVANTSSPATGTTSIIINHVKSDFVHCVGGVKRPFSSSSINNGVSSDAKWAAQQSPDIATHAAALNKTTNTIMGLLTFIGISWIFLFDDSSVGHTSSKNIQRNSSDSKKAKVAV